ncbi:MAG TPA: HD domain-containing phosphohydrolase, partial [Candidatus Limnocylindria bacterium]|nr:HD domain-containing phosphohydrolase [Candidatus Limnocylindria bacterium]
SMRSFLQSFKVERPWELEIAAMLAPIGRVTLPPTVLMKERSGLTLSVQEKEMLVRVPEVGAELLEQIPRLENVAQIVRYQHKHFDGSGFPMTTPGGTAIPLGARILQVLSGLADLELKGVKGAPALHQMLQSGGRYDPDVLSAAGRHFELLPAANDPATPAISVRVQDLKVGHVLAGNVETIESLLVVVAGTALSPMLLERLRNFAALGSISSSVLVRAAA